MRNEIALRRSRGVIRPSSSTWAASFSSVKTKYGTLRLCQDYRALDRLLVDDRQELGEIQSIIDRLRRKQCFTSTDLASGFSQLEIVLDDKHKRAFRDTDGLLWEANRAGLGLKCLPSTFANRIGLTLSDLKRWGVENGLDDRLIASDTFEDDTTIIAAVLTRLRYHGISVNFAKSKWSHPAQVFVGIVIDHRGPHPAESMVASIAQLMPPSAVAEVRGFLGMTGYSSEFIEMYSTKIAPLVDTLKNCVFQSARARKCASRGNRSTSLPLNS